MTRPLRIEFDGAIYLVTSSHNARELILIANTNRILFYGKKEPASTARRKTPGCTLYINPIYPAMLSCDPSHIPLHEARSFNSIINTIEFILKKLILRAYLS